MRLDRLIQVLLPHDEKFYSLFEEMTTLLMRGADLLKELPVRLGSGGADLVREFEDLEHQADSVTHRIYAELNATFVTPFDREDIHELASALDDIMDFMNGVAERFLLYKVSECPPPTVKLIDILHSGVEELEQGIPMLRDFHDNDALKKVLERINTYENEADDVFDQAIADLFENERDPVKIIKLKEIYVSLETATDKCEDAANVLETILIKHA